jgi:hypothetical protein
MTNWEEKLAEKAQKINRLNKQAVGNTRQDMSLPVLEDLASQGYQIVEWDSGASRHSRCVDLNRQKWNIEDFVGGLNFSAPLFEKSHPGDINCTLIVSGPNLSDVRVDSYGNTDTSISTPQYAPKTKTPVAPKRVRQAPVQKPKQVNVPLEPKKKYQYVPKKEWEQIPEQPSLHDVTEEAIPPKKELTDEEWDEIKNFNVETSLNKARNLLKGIVEE